MNETLDFRYFGIIPDDLALMRRIVVVLNDDWKSQSKSIREADALIKNYAFRWDARRDIRHFFETGGLKSRIKAALPKRKLFEKLALKHELFSLVLKIFQEYKIYVFQYEKTRTFIKKQRSSASSEEFFLQVFNLTHSIEFICNDFYKILIHLLRLLQLFALTSYITTINPRNICILFYKPEEI